MKAHRPIWFLICVLGMMTVACDEDPATDSTPEQAMYDAGRAVSNDSSLRDAQVVETPDALTLTDISTAPELTVEIQSPMQNQLLPIETPVIIRGRVSLTPGDINFVSTQLTLDGSTDLAIQLDPSGGFETELPPLQGGQHSITLTARLYPDIVESTSVNFTVDCSYAENFDSALDTDTWRLYGDELGVVETWLELTNNRINTASAHG